MARRNIKNKTFNVSKQLLGYMKKKKEEKSGLLFVFTRVPFTMTYHESDPG
uniref:Uncharacterized protein n=1 Tax=Pundamilia nyererei TaxID=303518 RepID=A0A3B4GU91_9CICH